MTSSPPSTAIAESSPCRAREADDFPLPRSLFFAILGHYVILMHGGGAAARRSQVAVFQVALVDGGRFQGTSLQNNPKAPGGVKV